MPHPTKPSPILHQWPADLKKIGVLDVGFLRRVAQVVGQRGLAGQPRGVGPLGLQAPLLNRWTGMDGVRTAEGGEGVTGAIIRARIRVDGRLAAVCRRAMSACSGCGEGDGGIGHGKRRSRTGLARVCGDVGLAGGSVADGRRQAGSGMARSRARARLAPPRASAWEDAIRRAERVSRPARAKNRRRRVLVVTIRSPRPMRAVQRARLCHHLDRQPGAVGGEAARGEMVQPDAVLEVAYRILDLGVAAVVGLQFQGLSVPVGDEAVIRWRREPVENRAPASPAGR